eukprot:762975-Hanusia_phi.AAC.4
MRSSGGRRDSQGPGGLELGDVEELRPEGADEEGLPDGAGPQEVVLLSQHIPAPHVSQLPRAPPVHVGESLASWSGMAEEERADRVEGCHQELRVSLAQWPCSCNGDAEKQADILTVRGPW